MKTLWLYRPLLNWRDVFQWGAETGVEKMLPPEQLHATLATVREPVDWSRFELQTDEIIVPAGHKVTQIFGFIAKAIAFGSPEIKARHEELAEIYPAMDHAEMLRPHVTIMRGGKMPKHPYLGELIFGPEVAEEFIEQPLRIKHVKVKDYVDD